MNDDNLPWEEGGGLISQLLYPVGGGGARTWLQRQQPGLVQRQQLPPNRLYTLRTQRATVTMSIAQLETEQVEVDGQRPDIGTIFGIEAVEAKLPPFPRKVPRQLAHNL